MLLVAALVVSLTSDPAPGLDTLQARLEEHPALVALVAEAEARRLDGQSRLGLPNPNVALGINNVPVTDPLQFDEYLPSSRSVTVTQPLPGRALRRARSAADEAQAGLVLAQLNARRDELQSALLVALREIQTARRVDALVRQQLSVYDELADVLESATAAGESRFVALADMDADRAEADTLASDATRLEAQARSRIESLVGPVGALPEVGAITLPETNTALQFHAVELAGARARAADAGVTVRERDFDLGYEVSLTYSQRQAGANFDGDDWVSARVGVSVPIWSRWTQQPALEAARRDADAARLRVSDAHRTALDAYQSAAATYAAAHRSRTALETRIAALEALSEAAQREYETGAGDLRPVLEARANAIGVQIRALQLQLEADRAAARMHALSVD